jgi:hypothetical protein
VSWCWLSLCWVSLCWMSWRPFWRGWFEVDFNEVTEIENSWVSFNWSVFLQTENMLELAPAHFVSSPFHRPLCRHDISSTILLTGHIVDRFVNLVFFQLAIVSNCLFVKLPFCQLAILLTYHLVNLPYCWSFDQLGIFQLAILSNCHLVKLPFHRPLCHHNISSTILSTGHFADRFVDLVFFNLQLCLIAILSNYLFVNLSFCQITILSTCHFVNLPFCQLAILSTCHFVKLPFCQPAILSTHHLSTWNWV